MCFNIFHPQSFSLTSVSPEITYDLIHLRLVVTNEAVSNESHFIQDRIGYWRKQVSTCQLHGGTWFTCHFWRSEGVPANSLLQLNKRGTLTATVRTSAYQVSKQRWLVPPGPDGNDAPVCFDSSGISSASEGWLRWNTQKWFESSITPHFLSSLLGNSISSIQFKST